MTADMADDLVEHGVSIVSVYPGMVRTEMMIRDHPMGARIAKAKSTETPEFIGRAVAALYIAQEKLSPGEEKLSKGYSGRVLQANEVATEFGYVDVDGHMPADKVMASVRQEMQGPPWHWLKPGMADPTPVEHRGTRKSAQEAATHADDAKNVQKMKK